MDMQIIRKKIQHYGYVAHYEHFFRIEDCEGIRVELELYGKEAELIWKHMLMKEIERAHEDMWGDAHYEDLPHINLSYTDTAVLRIASTPTP